MAAIFSTGEEVAGGGSIIDAATGERQDAVFGSSVLPALGFTYTFGTGDGAANKWHLKRRTLAATTFDNLNLTSGLTALSTTQVFTALKRVFVAIISPDGVKKLRVGPQGQTNANLLWFQAATANFWEETFAVLWKDRPVTGWAVAPASTDILSIYNPGAAPVDYAIWLLGTG